MKIGILGTGNVGQILATGISRHDNCVVLGSRGGQKPQLREWLAGTGGDIRQGTFEEAARFGDVLFNCTAGAHSLDALQMAGAEHLRGKILVDVANPLDFSAGFPPTLTVVNTDSLGEQIQRAHPEARVVKTLNTINAQLMTAPGKLPVEHDLFICGDDDEAKAFVRDLLQEWFGWNSFIDLGGIPAARGTEAYLLLWVRLMEALGNPTFNVSVIQDVAMSRRTTGT